jgi:membrane protease YdiL (CAAX protease family)
VAVLLLAVIVGLCCAIGAMEFVGVASGVNGAYLIALVGAFFVQSMAEEVMSRGFLFKSLSKRVSMPVAIIVSAAAFSLGHLPSVLEAEGWFAVIGVANLFLVSAVFALLYHLRANIYVVGGLHCLWNFLLYGVMGLSVSGSTGNENALLQFHVPTQNVLNGGVYGLEAGIITTAVLLIAVVLLAVMSNKKER